MARIRTVKPEFWTDEKIVECSFEARLMFIGMFNFADDKGNLVRSPKRIKMQIFPADIIDCEPLIKELTSVGLIREYSVNGVEYLHIEGFSKHQKINRPSTTAIPAPSLVVDDSGNNSTESGSDSMNDTNNSVDDSVIGGALLHDDSVSPHVALTDGKEGKGKEKEGSKNTMSDSNRTADENYSDHQDPPAPENPKSESGGLLGDANKPDPVETAFEEIFWVAGLRKDNKVKAKSAFKTKYQAWKKNTRGTPEEFATLLEEDIRWRVKSQIFGTDRLLPTSYLSGERWNDERSVSRSDPSSIRASPVIQHGKDQVFIDYDALRERNH